MIPVIRDEVSVGTDKKAEPDVVDVAPDVRKLLPDVGNKAFSDEIDELTTDVVDVAGG